jgi:hypothetical protein
MKGTREISQRGFTVKSFGRYVYDPDLKSKQIGIKAHGDLNSTPKAVNHSPVHVSADTATSTASP